VACYRRSMILLITPSARGQECAATLKEATGNETHWAENLQQAVARLREQTYSAVVIDQFILENEPAESDQVLEHLDTAFPVYINFAVSGMERLVREVRSAFQRARARRLKPAVPWSSSFAARWVKALLPCCFRANWPCRFLAYRACGGKNSRRR